MSVIKRILVNKGYLSFFIAVPLLTSSAFIQVECPVCEGGGTIISSHNMQYVRIDDVDTELKRVQMEACTMALIYKYGIEISVSNDNEREAIGYLEMVLVNYETGRPISTEYVVIEVAGGASIRLSYDITFRTGTDVYSRTGAAARVLVGDIPDSTCGGTGRIPLNKYPLISLLKQQVYELQKAEIPWQPPPHFWEGDHDIIDWIYEIPATTTGVENHD
jgi:hypothetical protein